MNVTYILCFAAQVTDLRQQILGLANKQGIDIKGFAKAKAKLRFDLTIRTMSLVGKMFAYAMNKDDEVLKQKLSLSKSELETMADMLPGPKCQQMTQLGDTIKADAGPYGVMEALITEINLLVDNFMTAIPTTKTAIKDKKLVTEETGQRFEACEKILARIDSFAEMVRYDNPQFYSGFQSNRKVEDTSRRTRAMLMQLFDAKTGLPLANARVVMKHTSGTEFTKSVKKTRATGVVYMNPAADGAWEYEVTLSGYEVARGTFFITNGATTGVEVRLVRVPAEA